MHMYESLNYKKLGITAFIVSFLFVATVAAFIWFAFGPFWEPKTYETPKDVESPSKPIEVKGEGKG